MAKSSKNSAPETIICASCPQMHQEQMNKICKDLNITKAYAKKGDTLDMLSGNNWIPKWESKVVATAVTLAQTLGSKKVKILCISGGHYCDQEMARQPSLVRAIKREMAEAGNESFQVKVEWLEFDHFLEEYNVRPSQSERSTRESVQNPAEFVCPSCDREFTSEQSLSQHMEATGHLWKCRVCEREFTSANSLQQHSTSSGHDNRPQRSAGAEKKVTEENSFSCPGCNREFISEQSLSHHMEATNHWWKCNVCEREFASEQSLEQHASSTGHQSRPPKTIDQRCDRESVKTKKKEIEEEPKPKGPPQVYTCRVCSRAFNSKQGLNQHLEATNHQTSASRKPVRGTCFCGLSLNSYKAFQDHLRQAGAGAVCARMTTYFQSTDYDVIAKGVIHQSPGALWEDGPPRFVSADQDSITLEWNSLGSHAGIRGIPITYSVYMVGVPDQPLHPIETNLWFEDITKKNKISGCTVRKKNLAANTNYFFRVIGYHNEHCSSNYSPISQAMRVAS